MVEVKDMKLRYDGHGLNAQDGTRIAKVSIARYAEGRNAGINPQFDDLSETLATAWNALGDMKNLVAQAEKVLADIDDQDTGWYYQFQAAVQKARKAITPDS